MATAIVDHEEQLEESITQLEKRIDNAAGDCADWEMRKEDVEHELSTLRAEYAEAAELEVLGRGRGAVPRLVARISDQETKLTGVTRVLSSRRAALAALKVELQPLHEERTRRARAAAIAEEQSVVDTEIAGAADALKQHSESATKFWVLLKQLRERKYLSDATMHHAFDACISLQRRMNGFRE